MWLLVCTCSHIFIGIYHRGELTVKLQSIHCCSITSWFLFRWRIYLQTKCLTLMSPIDCVMQSTPLLPLLLLFVLQLQCGLHALLWIQLDPNVATVTDYHWLFYKWKVAGMGLCVCVCGLYIFYWQYATSVSVGRCLHLFLYKIVFFFSIPTDTLAFNKTYEMICYSLNLLPHSSLRIAFK